MYKLNSTKNFSKSLKKIIRNNPKYIREIDFIIDKLQTDKILDIKYKDHKLKGEYEGYRECHIRPDLLLIYKKQNVLLILVLLDIGSHSELF